MKKTIPSDINPKGYQNLLLQILNVKNFVSSIGGGIFIFSTAYLNSQWAIAQTLFWYWLVIEGLWVLFLIFTYKSELWQRVFFFILSIIKKMLPLIVIAVSLYFILFPFDLRKTISLSILAFVYWTLVKSKPVFKEKRSKTLNQRKRPKQKTGETSSDNKQLEGWTATETGNEQGSDYREVNLESKPLKSLEFKIKPFTTFWRAGLKITDPNGTILPLRTSNSFLFHLGSTDLKSKFGLTAYLHGDRLQYLNKTLDYDSESTIVIRFEVNDKNFVRCWINDRPEFELKGRIDPEILKKAFVVAWGDGNPYRVDINEIQFRTR